MNSKIVSSAALLVCLSAYFVTFADQCLAQHIDVALDTSHFWIEEVGYHTDIIGSDVRQPVGSQVRVIDRTRCSDMALFPPSAS